MDCGGSTSLNALHTMIREGLHRRHPGQAFPPPECHPDRAGDIRHSQADIRAISELLDYRPRYEVPEGLDHTLDWFCAHLGAGSIRTS